VWFGGQSVEGLAETLVIAGGSVSVTVTVNEHVAEYPIPFVAEQLTVVVPTGNADPDDGVHVTVGVGDPPEETVNVTTAEQLPGSLSLLIFDGHAIEGGESAVVYVSGPSPAL
jgi:hypothetical protein